MGEGTNSGKKVSRLKKFLVFGTVGMLFWGNSSYLLARQELFPQSEELFFQEIPVVVTASRYEQKITESPSTIYVVTETDIKESGATSIPDALRMVPGLDVLTISLYDQNINSRGYISQMANTILVMIDGRSVNEDLFGFVLWDTLSIELCDIKRIEVVRGPGSALYGANALTGVINIITKSPQEAEGDLISLRAGNFKTRIGSLVHGRKNDRLSYKFSLGGQSADEWRKTKGQAGELFRGNGLIGYKINERSSLSLSAGRSDFDDTRIASFSDFGVWRKNGWVNYWRGDYESSNLKARIWWKQFYGQNRFEIDPEDVFWDGKTLDSEIQHNLFVGKNYKFIWGLNYRRNIIHQNAYLNPKNQSLYSLFIQNEFKVMDKLTFFAGGRRDRHPITKDTFSPRGSAIYSFDENNILRVSAGSAYRNPNQVESYMYRVFDIPIPDTVFSFTMTGQGDKNLEAAKIETYETAYQTQFRKKLKLNFNLFYNKIYNLIWYGTTQYYAESELFPGSPGGILPKVQSFYNFGKSEGYGEETEIEMLFFPWLRGLVNYSYQISINRTDDSTTFTKNEKDERNEEIPLHKINCGLEAKHNNISVNLVSRYVSEAFWIRNLGGEERREKVNGYNQIDSRIGYRINEGLEIAVSGFNIFNEKHNEFVIGWGPTAPISDEIGRRITADVSYKF